MKSTATARSVGLVLVALLSIDSLLASGCKPKEKPMDDSNARPTGEGKATSRELLTMVGIARAIQTKNKDVPVPGTNVTWPVVIALDNENAIVGGKANAEAVALRTEDAGRSWTTIKAGTGFNDLVTYNLGDDKTLVFAVAKRQIPTDTKKKPPKEPVVQPIDTLTIYFQRPGEKLSAPWPIFYPDAKGPGWLISKGMGHQAVMMKPATSDAPSSPATSFLVETPQHQYLVAYGTPGNVPTPAPLTLPGGEAPVFAAYGRPAALLTVTGRDLLVRPWPIPGESLVPPKPIPNVKVTKTLADELSQGPECEYKGWSFRRFMQDKKTFVLAVSKDKQAVVELPASVDNTQPMACNEERVTVEATDPKNNEPALVTCLLSGGCVEPQNHAFFRPWTEKHERKIMLAATKTGITVAQTSANVVHWEYLVSYSANGGALYERPREVGVGKDDRGRMDLGAMVPFGDRIIMLLTADITGTTSRGWFCLATEDNLSWGPP